MSRHSYTCQPGKTHVLQPCYAKVAPGKVMNLVWFWLNTHHHHLNTLFLIFSVSPQCLVLSYLCPWHHNANTLFPWWNGTATQPHCFMLTSCCRCSLSSWGHFPLFLICCKLSWRVLDFVKCFFPYQLIWSYDFSSIACWCGSLLWFLNVGSAFICFLKHE